MTRQTDITSDLDTSKNNDNDIMLTCCFFDNNDQQNKKKFVFDLTKGEASQMINKATSNGKKWEQSD